MTGFKCKNCRTGVADGGYKKRIRRELQEISEEKNRQIKSIDEAYKKKTSDEDKIVQRNLIKETNEKYNKLYNDKTKEECKRDGKCCYCKGKGRR